MATGTFNTGGTDASGYTTLSSGVEAATGAAFWNGKYRSNPVGVSEGGGLSFRSLVKIPIDFSLLTGAVQITAATLQLRYFDTGGTYDQVKNTGSRTVNLHRALVSFTESPGIDDPSGWASSSTQNWNTKLKTAGTHYDATVIASKALTTAVGDKVLHEYDILSFIQKIAPASLLVGSGAGVVGEGLTNNGILLKMNTTNSSQGAEYYSREGATAASTTVPTIVLTYTTNQAPNKPVPTSPLSGAIQNGAEVTLSAPFTDPDAGDAPSGFDIEISSNADYSSPIFSQTYVSTQSPMTANVNMANFTSGVNYYWRIRSRDTAGTNSPWSNLASAYFTAPTNVAVQPPQEGNPNFAVTISPSRNKYRLEFYPLAAGATHFDPSPAAVIFDAKKIGVAQQVNASGEFFFTVASDHPQISKIVPQKTFWRASRWDERAGFFRIMSEGLIVKSTSYPNEVVFYGLDKIGMINRTVVSTKDIGADFSHVSLDLDQLHDDVMRRGSRTASVTAATVPATGEVKYTSTSHPFRIGDALVIAGTTAWNMPLATVIAVAANDFTIRSATTSGTFTTGTATLADSVSDLGWSASPASRFRDYSVTNSGNTTATTTKSVKIAGLPAIQALGAMADVLMAGTTNRVIIENPNIGLPAAKIDTMSVGLRHRHLTLEQVTKPSWSLWYGVNVKRYKIEDNLDRLATRAIIVNEETINPNKFTTATSTNGDVDLYNEYKLIDVVEDVSEEKNELDYAGNLLYNLNPNRLFTIETDLVQGSISPFDGYAVGDDISVYIKDDQVSIAKDLTLVAQQFIGSANGAEFLAFGFAQKIAKEFLVTGSDPETPLSRAEKMSTTATAIQAAASAAARERADQQGTLASVGESADRGMITNGDGDKFVDPTPITLPPQPTLNTR